MYVPLLAHALGTPHKDSQPSCGGHVFAALVRDILSVSTGKPGPLPLYTCDYINDLAAPKLCNPTLLCC